jgi:hypothetical protein
MNNKYCILLIFCLFLAFTSCKKEQSITTHNPEDDFKCITNFTKPEKEYFPFSEADSVVIVSYDIVDTISHGFGGRIGYPQVLSDSLENSKTLERVTLTKSQSNFLKVILYNFKPKNDTISMAASCYTPRHAILFYKQKKMIEYLEICLECYRMDYINKKSHFGSSCEEKWCLLQKYFATIGIKDGLNNRCEF